MLFIRIQDTPGAIERVLQPFTVSSLVPRSLAVRLSRSGGLFVWLQFSGISAEHGLSLAARLRNMHCVHAVRLSFDRCPSAPLVGKIISAVGL